MAEAAAGKGKKTKYEVKSSAASSGEVVERTAQPEERYVGRREPLVHARFIFECGLKLGMGWPTICAAAGSFHRVSREPKALQLIDPYTWAIGCLKIAADLDDLPVPDRDLVNAAYGILHPDKEPLDLLTGMLPLMKTLFQVKKRIAAILKCDFCPELPHKFFLHYIDDLDRWCGPRVWPDVPIPKVAWSLLQNCFLSPKVLNFKPQQLALAVIYCALLAGNRDIEQDGATVVWHEVLYKDSPVEVLQTIIEVIMSCIGREAELYPNEKSLTL